MLPEMTQSARQTPRTQISPPAQLVPSVTLDQAVVEEAGVQIWQALEGFDSPDVYAAPPM